jgi:Domain of unknown function (DUF4336)
MIADRRLITLIVLFVSSYFSSVDAFPSANTATHRRRPVVARLVGAEKNSENDEDARRSCSVSAAVRTALNRRSVIRMAAGAVPALLASVQPSRAEITADSTWPLWVALPVAPYSRRKTIRQTIVRDQVWIFDQLIGIYYVHVPIRMTVTKMMSRGVGGGLLVYAPVAPTRECLALLQELIDRHGPVQRIVLPSVAVEHKVNAGPFARNFPKARFYAVDRQYSFPVPLPSEFLGLPPWSQPLPASSRHGTNVLGEDFEYEVLTVKPGPGSQFQDVALLHKPSKTLMVCDAVFAAGREPPAILTAEPEYTRALLFHARDAKDEDVPDTPENRRKGWRRITLLFNFFFPGSGKGDLGPGPVLDALKTPNNKYGWGGWMPFTWGDTELKDFDTFSDGGKPTILPIIQIILAREPEQVNHWVRTISTWKFVRVIPAHLDAPLNIGPSEFSKPFEFARRGSNVVRFCDEDVEFLRAAEEGPLSFSVYKSDLGTLRGVNGKCGLLRGPSQT